MKGRSVLASPVCLALGRGGQHSRAPAAADVLGAYGRLRGAAV